MARDRLLVSTFERRKSSDLEWINKYQHSDHHKDRQMRTTSNYENAFGQPFPSPTDDVSAYRRNSYSQYSSYPPIPVSYEAPKQYEAVGSLTIQLNAPRSVSIRHPNNILRNDVLNRMPPASPRRPSSKLTTLWGRQLLPDHFHTTIHHVQPATDYNRSISLPPSSPMTSRRSSVASNSEFLPRCSTLPSRNVYTVPSSTLRRASVDNFSAAGLARDRRSISQDVERPRRGSMISQFPLATSNISAARRRIRDVLYK